MTFAPAVGAHRPRVLVLGGSTEGFTAAEKLTALGYDVVSSFAGRTTKRRSAAGVERVGGFGGAKGLEVYLAVENIDLVFDATHPFASQIKRNAVAACAGTATPLIHVDRPRWTAGPGDDWRFAPDVAAAAEMAPATEGVCFITLGRQQIHHFERRHDLDLLFRVIDPPERAFDHPSAAFLFKRGPFALDDERILFDERNVRCLVTKNSGSHAADAKLTAARERGVPVIVIDRPAPLDANVFPSVEIAIEAARELLDAGGA